MSCPSSGSQSANIIISAGALPEGYCPPSWQQALEDFAERLIATQGVTSSTFVSGPVMPTSNQGPWAKNCSEWFFWNDERATYVPPSKGGFTSLTVYDASATYIVPDDVYRIMVEAWGAGGGGAVVGGAGGGSYGLKIFDVNPGDAFPFTIGAGGANGNPGANGGNTVFSTMTAGGGEGGGVTVLTSGGRGGTATGATLAISGAPGMGADPDGNSGQGGGDSPRGGGGGQPASDGLTKNGVLPGGGGGAGYSTTGTGGTGAGGRIIIWT